MKEKEMRKERRVEKRVRERNMQIDNETGMLSKKEKCQLKHP